MSTIPNAVGAIGPKTPVHNKKMRPLLIDDALETGRLFSRRDAAVVCDQMAVDVVGAAAAESEIKQSDDDAVWS